MRLVKHESAVMHSQDPTDGLEYDKNTPENQELALCRMIGKVYFPLGARSLFQGRAVKFHQCKTQKKSP